MWLCRWCEPGLTQNLKSKSEHFYDNKEHYNLGIKNFHRCVELKKSINQTSQSYLDVFFQVMNSDGYVLTTSLKSNQIKSIATTELKHGSLVLFINNCSTVNSDGISKLASIKVIELLSQPRST